MPHTHTGEFMPKTCKYECEQNQKTGQVSDSDVLCSHAVPTLNVLFCSGTKFAGLRHLCGAISHDRRLGAVAAMA